VLTAPSIRPLAPRETLADVAYKRIKEDILKGILTPGASISTGQIARRLETSQMPVRNALTRLEAEGLVTIAPQRGVAVTPVTPVELQEVSVIRSRLEGLAANLAAAQVSAPDVDTLEGFLTEMEDRAAADDATRWVKANTRFHDQIIEWSANGNLIRLLRDVRHRGMRARIIFQHVPGHMDRRNQEHRQILKALQSRHGRLAERLMSAHVLAASKELVAYVKSESAVPR
jgi:DNA-binding GntR family transcriptional regulator